MMIITVKYIVIVAILTICGVHTCIQTFSLLSLQQTIRIYAAVHGMKFYSVISDIPKLKESNSWLIINLEVLSQTVIIEMYKTHSDHGLYWLPRKTYSFKSSSIACNVDMRWHSPIFYATGDYMKSSTSMLNKTPYENWRTLQVAHSKTAFIMKECKYGSIC